MPRQLYGNVMGYLLLAGVAFSLACDYMDERQERQRLRRNALEFMSVLESWYDGKQSFEPHDLYDALQQLGPHMPQTEAARIGEIRTMLEQRLDHAVNNVVK